LLSTPEEHVPGRFCSTWSYAMNRLPPLVGSPSTAYHCRSTTTLGTPVHVPTKVVPWSEERAVEKLAAVRSLK